MDKEGLMRSKTNSKEYHFPPLNSLSSVDFKRVDENPSWVQDKFGLSQQLSLN